MMMIMIIMRIIIIYILLVLNKKSKLNYFKKYRIEANTARDDKPVA